MGEGIFRRCLGDRFEIHSAGTMPSFVRPEAIAVMAEIGTDISSHRSKSVDEPHARNYDFVVTACDNAKQSCFPADTRRVQWSVEDPSAVEGGQPARLAPFHRIRDQIRARVEQFTKSI